MKKLVALVAAALYFILPLKLYANENDSIIDWTLDRSVYVHKIQNGEEKIENLAFITANEKIAYCVLPGVMADKGGVYNSTNDGSVLNISDETLKYITLVGYFGYDYDNHMEKEYYMAAQEMIWEALGVSDVWWTSERYANNIDINYYKNQILSLVNNYDLKPDFNFNDNYLIGSKVELIDNNSVLSNYYTENENITINDNKLIIKKINEENEFILKRKVNDNMTTFYYKDGYQSVASFTSAYSYDNYYKVNGVYKDVILEKKDYDTKENIPLSESASLKDAVYGLYDSNDNLIKEEKTNEDGIITFSNLSYGNYYIKELKASEGYNIDKNTYDVVVDESNVKKVISYEKIIENEITIIKFLQDENTLTPEADIAFNLYDSDDKLYGTYKTNQDGVIKITLPYGKYLLKQVTKLDNITVAEDKEINVSNNDEENTIVLINKKILLPKAYQEDILPNTSKKIDFRYLFTLEILIILVLIYEKRYV